jgi:cation transport protein ChaC
MAGPAIHENYVEKPKTWMPGTRPGVTRIMVELWVFGYGSLMWRPGFPFAEAQPALLKGAHRALCVYSVVHRGTHAAPGLVLGLDRGGACRGVAYRVASGAEDETVAYLREREQVTDVYVEAIRPIRLLDGSGRVLKALTYLVDRNHAQYAGDLPLELQIRIVKGGKGQAGGNVEYVIKTLRHLHEAGVRDPLLSEIAVHLTEPAAEF